MNAETQMIIQMVENSFNRLMTTEYQRIQQQISPQQFREQFSTITIDLQRGVGHSMAAAKLITKYPNSLLFTYKELLKTRLLELITQELTTQIDVVPPIMSDIKEQIVVIPKCNAHVTDYLLRTGRPSNTDDKYDLLIIDDFSHVPYLTYLGIQSVFNNYAHLFVELH